MEPVFKKIDHPSITDAIVTQILKAIRRDVYKPGERLPSEPELANQFNVSRNTLREAIKSLIEQGIIYSKRGIGNFISPQSKILITGNLINLMGTSSVITAQDRSPGQKKFYYQIENPSEQVAKALKISQTAEVIHISRIRTADGVPMILSDEYFPTDIENLDYNIEKYGQLQDWSIYDYFSKAGYEIMNAIVNIHAVSADEKLAEDLRVELNSPLISLEQLHFSLAYDSPLLFCVNIHNDQIMNLLLMRSAHGVQPT